MHMKINILVKGRVLENPGSFRIASGSLNDVYIAFDFEPGHGWENLDITAVFTRTEQRAYITNIRNGVSVAVPATVLQRPGNIFVSLVGCKGESQVATSLTTTLTVEHNAMNILNPALYPVNDAGNMDTDAYAQYVALVNNAATRAELAADKAESLAIGWYTKEESDNRYAKRVRLTTWVDGKFDTDSIVSGDVPTLTIPAVTPLSTEGSITQPAGFETTSAVSVLIKSPAVNAQYNYSGFNLRRLNNKLYDTLVIGESGAIKYERIYALKVANAIGSWVSETQYALSLVSEPALNLAGINCIMTNVGDCIVSASSSSIVLNLPSSTTEDQLKRIEVWYPLETPQSVTVSANALGGVPTEPAEITCCRTMGGEHYPVASFGVMAELDIAKYMKTYSSKLETVFDQLARMKEGMKIMSTALAVKSNVQQAMVGIADIDMDDAGKYYVNLNVSGAQILGVATAEENVYRPIDWYCEVPDGVTSVATKIYVEFKDNTPEPVVITYAINATPIQPRGGTYAAMRNANTFTLASNI